MNTTQQLQYKREFISHSIHTNISCSRCIFQVEGLQKQAELAGEVLGENVITPNMTADTLTTTALTGLSLHQTLHNMEDTDLTTTADNNNATTTIMDNNNNNIQELPAEEEENIPDVGEGLQEGMSMALGDGTTILMILAHFLCNSVTENFLNNPSLQ